MFGQVKQASCLFYFPNKQGSLFYLPEQAGMRVLPKMNKQGSLFYLPEQPGILVLPKMNKQGCVFYPRSTSRDACSTQDQQAGMRVLPKMNKQGCVFYPRSTTRDACSTQDEQAGTLVLPANEEKRSFAALRRDACSTKPTSWRGVGSTLVFFAIRRRFRDVRRCWLRIDGAWPRR
ncbi:MAG: hypothetical protein ACPGWR_08555 [Ardenticatenaceae bacterium]